MAYGTLVLFLGLKNILVLLAKRDSGELRYHATALISSTIANDLYMHYYRCLHIIVSV